MTRANRRIRFAVAGAAVTTALVATGCGTTHAESSSTASQQPDSQEVQALFDEWNGALATLDPEAVADRYAPDAVLLPTVSNEVRTDRAGIVDYFEHFLENKPQGTILESHVTALGPNAAIDTGTYRFALTQDGQPTTVDARYTFVYERVGDEWLIVNHHSSAMPEN